MTLRCMIEKSELDRLLFIESKYKGLSTSAILKKGEGAQPSTCKDEEDCDEDPLAEDKSDQRNGSTLIEKNTILPTASSVSLVTSTTGKSANSELTGHWSELIGIQDIVSGVRKRFQKRAKQLLDKLKSNPSLYVNHLGEISIDDIFYKNSNIKVLLENCYYQTKSQHITALEPFMAFLKSHQLYAGKYLCQVQETWKFFFLAHKQLKTQCLLHSVW
jgi:hypothetical protein